jgi:hypothetical protein
MMLVIPVRVIGRPGILPSSDMGRLMIPWPEEKMPEFA